MVIRNQPPSLTRQTVLRNLAAGQALANLCHLQTWTMLLAYTTANTTWMRSLPSRSEYYAAITNVLVPGLLFGFLLQTSVVGPFWLRRTSKILLTLGACIPALVVCKVIFEYNPDILNSFTELRRFPISHNRFLAAVACAVVLILIATIGYRHRTSMIRRCTVLLLIAFPTVPLTFGRAAWRILNYDDAPFRNMATAAAMPVRPGAPRVVWMIFDEWDQDLTFDHRDPSLDLPEVDRFRQEALYATAAYPPGQSTAYSVPAFITGRLIRETFSVGPRTFLVKFDGGNGFANWSKAPNVFAQAHAAGFNTGIVGWTFAYCRTLQQPMVSCYWDELSLPANSSGRTFGEALLNQNREIFETQFRSPFVRSLSAVRHGETYRDLLEHARGAVADPRLGLLYLHLPVPHAPFIYNRRSRQFDLGRLPVLGLFQSDQPGYIDGLALVDETLKTLRHSMEAAGLWDSTTILLSADHSNRHASALTGRARDHRVPFLLKMAGQKTGTTYGPEFNSVLTSGLLLEVLQGQISTPAAVTQWLDRNRTYGRSPTDQIP